MAKFNQKRYSNLQMISKIGVILVAVLIIYHLFFKKQWPELNPMLTNIETGAIALVIIVQVIMYFEKRKGNE